MLRSGSTDERWAAARSLTSPTDTQVLAQVLSEEPESRVRAAILTSLARIGTAASAAAIVPYIRSNDASLRTGALDALATMPEGVAATLPGLLSDADPDVRLLACELVRVMPDSEATRLLSALIHRDNEPNVCAAAIEVLAEVGGPDVLPSLRRCAERFAEQPFLAFAVRVAIERIGGQTDHRLG